MMTGSERRKALLFAALVGGVSGGLAVLLLAAIGALLR